MSAVGPLARTATDLRTALKATAGPEELAAKAISWALPAPRQRRLDRFRVGVVLDHPQSPITAETWRCALRWADALTRAGVKVVEGWPEGIDPGQIAESFVFQVGLFFAFQEPGEQEFAPLSVVIEQEQRRMVARAAWSAYFHDFDVFLCPVNFTAAFPHDARPFDERTIATTDGVRSYADARPSMTGSPHRSRKWFGGHSRLHLRMKESGNGSHEKAGEKEDGGQPH